ncbi:MAG: HAMP domain-containing protein, partial [Caldilineae bacterium]
MAWLGKLRRLGASIGAKIILPYLLLTLLVAAVGAFIVTRLVTNTMQERFNNQLYDAGRIVSERMVEYERRRLEVLRAIAASEGVPEALAAGDRTALANLVPQIAINNNADAVELLNMQGREVYGWQRLPNQPTFAAEERTGSDYSNLEDVRLVLEGYSDDFGDKRAFLTQTPHGLMLFTIGPVFRNAEQVGAVMVGTYLEAMLLDLTESAVARVTLYDRNGRVIASTLGRDESLSATLQESPDRYETVLQALQETPQRYVVISSRAENEVPLRQVKVFGQEYTLAFGDWRIRGQSFGLFSVALARNFIISTADTNRNFLSLLFSIATIAVFGIGFLIAQRIIQPLNRLVQTALTVARGNLEQRTNIRRNDEIGTLAESFDSMTETLVERNRQLVEQASTLKTILNSIADAVIVLDMEGNILTKNPAAEQILSDLSDELQAEILHDLPQEPSPPAAAPAEAAPVPVPRRPRRYRIGNRVFSALAAPMEAPDGTQLGTVIAMRDVTREAEAEYLQDGFITSVSHELRTPLTAVKGYSDLLLQLARTGLNESHIPFIESISTNAGHLVHHINKLIDISELQAGTLVIDEDELDFAELVAGVAESWREKIEERGLKLKVSLPEEPVMVRGDTARLRWAVDNLLSNAYNYTPSG